jgi:hypothetical protein
MKEEKSRNPFFFFLYCNMTWKRQTRSCCFFKANSEALTADAVKTYLVEHPEFLDSYIQQNINSNTIEQLISSHKNNLSTINTSGRELKIIYDRMLKKKYFSDSSKQISSTTEKSMHTVRMIYFWGLFFFLLFYVNLVSWIKR